MDWLSVAILGIIWAAFLVPWPRRGTVARGTFPDLRRNVELRSDSTQQPGRWVLAPKKGTRFVGPRERARLRARERRRRVVVVLLEAIALTALIGIFPPLRPMFVLTAFLSVLLVGYLGLVALMVSRDRIEAGDPREQAAVPRTVAVLPQAARNSVLETDQERLARVVSR
jgi:hypothetical protein